MSEYILEMKNICKSFATVPVLDHVNLQIKPGEVHALMGENGAGKSTLMKILMGIYSANSGDVLINGEKVIFKNPKEAMHYGISMIHQELNPILDMEVSENVFVGREIRKMNAGAFSVVDKKQMRKECAELFDALSIPIQPTELMRNLSVAQTQLVEIVKAISLSSKIIIMDEPTSAITDHEVEVLFQQIEVLKSQNVAVIYISHKMDEIFDIADRITVLRDGGYIGTDHKENMSKDKLIKMMVGREITEAFPKVKVDIDEEALSVKNLSYGNKFQNVSFSVRRGEILGIAGLVGAGRSEVVETLFGMNKATSGEVLINGTKKEIHKPLDAIRNKIALITEDRKFTGLNLEATVEENITIVSLNQLFKNGIINKRAEADISEAYIEKLKIKAFSRKALITSLSGGNQQKVVLAKWLLSQPEIIIFDEPTRGIDVGAKREIYLLIGEMVKNGKAVIMISSEIPEIMGLSDRIIVMAGGKLTGEIKKADFSQELIMKYASQFSGGENNVNESAENWNI
ncbi:MAG: sugar ABC transporter ATP-binding protein [Clostridia bacterium]|nr:sugar ABC transporter ATP-binding protein [Clostridia bacterium]